MTSTPIARQSPAALPGRPAKTEVKNHWKVVLEYTEEGTGPWVVDLSHCRRLDVQGRDLQGLLPGALPVPATPGDVSLGQEMLITRMNAVQACLWLFDADVALPDRFEVTEVTEASVGLALLGEEVFRIAEKLTDLDLQDPKREPPFLLQGPFAHVPCQVIVLGTDPGKRAVMITCSRGYAHDMVHAMVAAGEEYGLRAGGEDRFLGMFKAIAGSA